MNKRRLLQKIVSGSKNIKFSDLAALLEALGFINDRVNGSYHTFKHPEVAEMVNIQNAHGEAKPYQVRQVVELIEAYGLTLGGEEENA